MKDLNKVDSILVDRLNFKKSVEDDLLKFIKLQVTKDSLESSVKVVALQELLDRCENKEEKISDLVLLKLIEILSKKENDLALGIMALMKNEKEKGNDNTVDNPGVIPKDSDLTKDDVANIKGLLDLLRKKEEIKKSEY